MKFIIENDLPEIGSYLYVFIDNKCIADYLENDISSCKEVALEEYGVPLDIWHKNGAYNIGSIHEIKLK